jgi:DNA polymerase I-like protein with 3'-5' exonuclease and polymerase domains
MFTADPEIGADASDLFNSLTGYSKKSDFRRLLVAPVTLRDRVADLIRRETALGANGHIILKMNALEDKAMIRLLYEASQAGVKVDRAELEAMSVDFAHRMAGMEAQSQALAGELFNLGSAKQLGEILFDRMKLPGGKRMKTGAWGTDASVLQGLVDQGHELPGKVLEWRQLAKLKSTYADALVEQINPMTGRVHTSFAMAITTTGRLSSTDPNLQNIPIRTEEGARIRRAFIAEPGHVQNRLACSGPCIAINNGSMLASMLWA